MKKSILNSFFFVLLSFLVSCSSTQCRRKDKVPAMPSQSNVDKTLNIKDNNKPETVYIFKYDGSLQCGMGQAIPLDEMAKELEGIKIYSKANKADGLMHIQVCGSNTGNANVYEIAKTELPVALQKGFKSWQF